MVRLINSFLGTSTHKNQLQLTDANKLFFNHGFLKPMCWKSLGNATEIKRTNQISVSYLTRHRPLT